MGMKYHAVFRTAYGSDVAVRLDGRLSIQNMRREALRIAQRREHYTKYLTFTIERHGPHSPMFEGFAMTLPTALVYPIQTS